MSYPGQERRERERVERRAAILVAARALMQERGFGGFRVEDIAMRAGCAVGSIYLHFKSDRQLYAELLREELGSTVGSGSGNLARRLEVLLRYVPSEFREAVLG